MKKIILYIFIIIAFSCGKSKEKEKSQIEIKTEAYNDSKSYIEDYEERISLLAISKGISGDTLKSILIDYHTEINMLDEIKMANNEKIISAISNKFQLSKNKVASLIYNFKYEMLTRDEIFEIEAEKIEAETAANQDPPEPF